MVRELSDWEGMEWEVCMGDGDWWGLGWYGVVMVMVVGKGIANGSGWVWAWNCDG